MTTSILTDVAPPPKSKAAQLADLLPAIEAALAAGHPHTAIFEHIQNKHGLALTYRYYHLTLHRLRRRRDEASGKQRSRAGGPAVIDAAEPASAQSQNASEISVSSSDTKANDLSVGITDKGMCQVGNIGNERTPAKPFRWKGQEFLEKDWTNF